MKKILISILVLLMLMMTVLSATAMIMPYPIYGKILSDGYPVQNAEVKVTNEATKATRTTTTNENGYYQVELANMPSIGGLPPYWNGNAITVALTFCQSMDVCSKTISVNDGGGYEVAWGIENIDVDLPDTTTILRYVCSDGSLAENQADCPIITTKVECFDGTLVDNKEDCPEASNSWLYYVIGVLAVLLGGAGGWKFYDGKFKHYHRGLTSYHDPSTRHTNPKYRHTLWKDNAIKCILDVRKIQNGLDLSK